MTINTDFDMVSGDNKVITVNIIDEAGRPLNINSATAADFWVMTRHHVTVVTKSLGDGVTLDSTNIVVTLLPADTVDLKADLYYTELQVIDAAGEVFTPVQGKLFLKKGYVTP
jgi:hypothetical protein